MNEEYEELKSLLYTGTISQYGKRKLIDLIEKQFKEIEELKEKSNKYYYEWKHLEADIINNYVNIDKIKAKIEELEKLDFGTDLVSQFTANLTTITILQSLLEKE